MADKPKTKQAKRRNISLKPTTMSEIERLANEEHRSFSRQIEHMLDFYLKYKDTIDSIIKSKSP